MLLVCMSLIQYKSLLLHCTFVRFPMNHMVTFKPLSMRLTTSHCKSVKILIYSITLHWTAHIHIHSSFVICLFFLELGKNPTSPALVTAVLISQSIHYNFIFYEMIFFYLWEHLNYSFLLLPEQYIFSTTLYSDMYVFILLDHESQKWLFSVFESSICTIDIHERVSVELIYELLHLFIVSKY